MTNGVNPALTSAATMAQMVQASAPENSIAPAEIAKLASYVSIDAGAPSQNIGKSGGKGGMINNANGAPQLGSISMSFSPDDLADTLLNLQSKTQQAQLETARNGLVTSGSKIEETKQNSLKKIKQWADKCKAAASKAKAGGILGWIKKLILPIAAAFAFAIASIATVATGGAAAPLLALATLALVSAIMTFGSDIDKARGGKGIDHVIKWMDPGSALGEGMSELAKKMGASDKDASIVKISFSVATTVAIIAATILLSGGASVGKGASDLTKSIMQCAQAGQIVAGIANGTNEVAQGGLNIAVAFDERDAAIIQSERKSLEAGNIKLMQMMEEGREEIKKVMDEISESFNLVSQMINSTSSSMSQIISNQAGKGQII